MAIGTATGIAKTTTLMSVALAGAMLIQPAAAQEDANAPKGAAVTVLRVAKSCFPDNVDVSGILIPREEISVRPDRDGLRVADTLADPGETVKAGQPLARLTAPDGASVTLTAPVAGQVSGSTAQIGMIAALRSPDPLFRIIPAGEFDLAAMAPAKDLPKLTLHQPAAIRVVGGLELSGKVRQVASTIEPNTQQGQVFVSVTSDKPLLVNASARAVIKTGESCGVSVPLTAVLYGGGATIVQVVRRQRVETRRVETGLMSGSQVEIREGLAEGDVVVARAGALLREGDPVRPIMADATPAQK